MYYIDDIIEQIMTRKNRREKPNLFSDCADAEQIADKMESLTLEKMEKDKEFMEEFPNPFYAIMRLEYLTESEKEEDWILMQDLFSKDQLLDHLKEVQREAIAFLRLERPRMMKSWGLTEEMEKSNPQEYNGLMNNLSSVLTEMVIKGVIEV